MIRDTTLASTKLMTPISPALPATACIGTLAMLGPAHASRCRLRHSAMLTDARAMMQILDWPYQECISIGVATQLLSTQPCQRLQALQHTAPGHLAPWRCWQRCERLQAASDMVCVGCDPTPKWVQCIKQHGREGTHLACRMRRSRIDKVEHNCYVVPHVHVIIHIGLVAAHGGKEVAAGGIHSIKEQLPHRPAVALLQAVQVLSLSCNILSSVQ